MGKIPFLKLDTINFHENFDPKYQRSFQDVDFPNLTKDKQLFYCYQGHELKKDYKLESKIKTIQEMAKQICNSYIFMADEEKLKLNIQYISVMNQVSNPAPYKHFLFVPIVITNAKLCVTDFAGDQIDINTGMFRREQINEIPVIEVDWLVYSYPLTGNLKELRRLETVNWPYQPFFIVRADKINEFLDRIKRCGGTK